MAKSATSKLVEKVWQYVVESSEGTTPTASPSFTAVPTETLGFNIDGQFEDITQIGPEDLLDIVQGPQVYDSTVKFFLDSATYLNNYGFKAANFGTPSGTPSETLSHVISVYLDGTENYIFFKGSRAKSAGLDLEIGKAHRGTIEFAHTNISTPATAHGLTTPSFASDPTSAIWHWKSGGTTPVSWNSVAIDCQKISVQVNRGTTVDHTLGNGDPHSSQLGERLITGTMTVLWTNDDLETDFKAGTARSLAIVLKSATSTLTLSNTNITSYKRTDISGGSGETIKEEVTFKAKSAAFA